MRYFEPPKSEKHQNVLGTEKYNSHVQVPKKLINEQYKEGEVLPPVQQLHYNRRILLEGGASNYRRSGQKRIYENGLLMKLLRWPLQHYRPRKVYGYELKRHKTNTITPTRKENHDWDNYAKLDVPSFGYYVPYNDSNE